MSLQCNISGELFEVSPLEKALRKKFHLSESPTTSPFVRIRNLAAFWQHWALHPRKCDKTGKVIISAFSDKCPYPVWHKDEWKKHANPPSADFDFEKSFFEQTWDLFQKCPIPHNTGTGSHNSQYTDDCWYSKNVYLTHSVFKCEDLQYCYRIIDSRDCTSCVFTFSSELCFDLVNCHNCFQCFSLLDCRQCRDSAFLYDCRNCSDCLFCSNLRNKKYCYGNQQLSPEEFKKKRAEWNLKSQKVYKRASLIFSEMIEQQAFHRTLFINNCEACSGNYLDRNKNCDNCFFSSDTEDSVNFLRGGIIVKDLLDIVGAGDQCELLYSSVNAMDHCYCVRWTIQLSQSKFCDYSAYCFQCEHCFGCCGLVGKKYHILNKEYSPKEYELLREKIINHMQETNEWGQFFPGYFAPNPYDESLAGFHFPLSKKEQATLGFRLNENEERKNSNYASPEEIPDSVDEITNKEELLKKVFWDAEFKKPFQIQKTDIVFARKIGCPLPNSYYMNRIQKNFRWIPFNGKLRKTTCGECGIPIQTSWDGKYDGRILCEKCYLEKF